MNRSLVLWFAGCLTAGIFIFGCGVNTFSAHANPTQQERSSTAVQPNVIPTSVSRLTVTMAYTYHSIYGITADELRHELNAKGYMDEKGRVWDAYTQWHVTWSYPYAQTADACRPGPVHVTVNIHYFLPKWNPPSNAPQSLIDQWNAYSDALLIHEEGHKDMGVAAGFAILDGLESLLSYPSCEAIEDAADALGKGIIQVYHQQEILYDRFTGYGETQGVCFP